MARSIQAIQDSFAHLASKDKAKAIRKQAADLWEKYHNLVPLIRDGYEVEKKSFITTNGRQDECINYISAVETALEERKKRRVKPVVETTVEPTVETTVEPSVEPSVELGVELGVETGVEPTVEPGVEPTVEPGVQPVVETPAQPTVETEYSDSEAERMAIAKKLYFATADKDDLTGLREYQLNLCKTQKYFLPEFAILVARTRVIIEDYANAKSPEGKAHPGSIQKIRVEVMRYLAQIIKPENDKFPPVNDRTLEDTFNDFETAVRGAFSDIGAIKYKLNKARAEAAEEDVRAIKVFPYLSWAIDTVNNLPQSAAKWKEIAIAVMVLTGRRQSEVMSSGIFTYVDDAHVIFEGQLKRHIAEVVPPEKIPVLGKAAQGVVNAVAWLDKFNKRTLPESRTVEAIQKAAKVSHDRCSRYIAETMATLCNLCQITNGKEWVVTEATKQVNKFKGHLNRQIYAQVCSALFNDANESKKRAYISRILLENRDAALSYDRDIEIQDIDALAKLCGSFKDE
ncbi:MAG TPA: protelomerase family protein [Leptolyngbyaceae cyanobacterium]